MPSLITYNEDADLWLNTASFTLKNIPAEATSVSVQYKKSTETAWPDRRNYRKQYKSGNKTRLGHAIYGGGLDYSQLCTTVLAHYRRNRVFSQTTHTITN